MEVASIEVSPKVSSEDQPKPIVEQVPKKMTTSLEIPPNQIEKSLIARKQLENLTKKPRKKASPVTSDSENTSIKPNESVESPQSATKNEVVSEILYDGKPTMSNLSSAIISKEELENEIRKKIVQPEATVKKNSNYEIGSIEIPQELILSEINTASQLREAVGTTQLDEQQLIDILEGKDDQPDEDGQIIEVIGENGMIIVKDNKDDQLTSYEIIATEDETMANTKQKLLEREIAIRQIASMPTRKNRKHKQNPNSSPTMVTSAVPVQKSLVQSLAMDWGDDDKSEEMILELENVEQSDGEPKIKILNMTIFNESAEEIKSPPKVVQLPVYKPEPKILNKNAPKNVAPKILNVNAPKLPTEEPKRVIKKKTIWDPSPSTSSSPAPLPTANIEKKSPAKMPINLPSTITIKKLTKDSLTKPVNQVLEQGTLPVAEQHNTPGRKGKKKSEVDKLFQDEGAVNMIYSLERQNNNRDVPEIKVSVDQKSMIDKTEEKTKLMAKVKTIKQTIIKQSVSPPEVKVTPTRPQRIKRDLTPNKSESESEKKSSQEKTEKTVIITKAQKTPTTGRKRKTDDSWDYVRNAQTTCDDAMIIRRHSNSSYSSSAPTSPRRLSLDQQIGELDDSMKLERNGFKFTKPQEKSPELQKDLKSCVGGLVEELRNTLSTKLSKGKALNEKTTKGKKRGAAASNANNNTNQSESPPQKRVSERRSNGSEKEFKIIKEDAITHIILTANPLTITLLMEVKQLLNQLENDESCKVVLITASEDFSKGLDYSTLVQPTVDKRKQAASDLVTAVKNFFIFLAAFPKVLVCGLKGSVSGIGVTMLPLFDAVIADSSTTFSLPHGLIGSNPEGISILQSSNKIKSNIITELFLMNEKLNVTSALSYGLISKVVPNNMESNVKDVCRKISALSSQALESTKNVLTEDFLSSIDQHLTKEVKILQQQWISAECQEKFKKYSTTGTW